MYLTGTRKNAQPHKCKTKLCEILPDTCQMTTIKKNTNNNYWQGCGEKGTLIYYWEECKMWKRVWTFLKQTKI